MAANGVMGFPAAPTAAQPSMYSRLLGGLLGRRNYGGLLTPEEEKAAQQQGLLALGANLMAAGGPSDRPVGLGQAIGSSLLAGQQATQQYGNDMLQAMLLKTKLQAAQNKNTNPSDVRSYEYAKANGYKGTFEDWKRVAAAKPQSPSAIQEYEYWKNLPTQDARDEYLTVKRSMQPFQLGEIGGGKVVFNRATGQWEQATTASQEAEGAGQIEAGKAGGKVTGESQAQAIVDLPRVRDNAKQALKTLDDFEKHPGFQYVFGMESPAPTIPGSPQAGALSYYDQIKGKTFLEAFNSLKGAGQITEQEGSKATDAIARLNRAQSDADARKALSDLREVINSGLSRAEKKAGVAPRKRFNPQTGKIE